MDRLEAQRRLFNAVQTLLRNGWRESELDAMITGRSRDDAVEEAERCAAQYPPPGGSTDPFSPHYRGSDFS